MLSYLRNIFSKKVVPAKSLLETVAGEYENLSRVNLRSVFSSDNSNKQMAVCQGNILLYTKHLKKLVQVFETDASPLNSSFFKNEQIVNLRDFFTNTDNRILDPEEHMANFMPLCSRFLELYNAAQSDLDPSINTQINLRLSRGVVSNLVSMIDTLKSI